LTLGYQGVFAFSALFYTLTATAYYLWFRSYVKM
jgi:hypothetical protein